MGTRILVGHEEGDYGYESEIACLFDSVTGWTLGPIFHRDDDGNSPGDLAQQFLDWLQKTDGRDPRLLTPREMEKAYTEWTKGERQGMWTGTD